jgi:hypothetical protein
MIVIILSVDLALSELGGSGVNVIKLFILFVSD